mgnify:CR=1 FL=1
MVAFRKVGPISNSLLGLKLVIKFIDDFAQALVLLTILGFARIQVFIIRQFVITGVCGGVRWCTSKFRRLSFAPCQWVAACNRLICRAFTLKHAQESSATRLLSLLRNVFHFLFYYNVFVKIRRDMYNLNSFIIYN